MSTISVLMSVYRNENPTFFDRALESIWSDQTRKPDEIILVEDGPLTCELNTVIQKWQHVLLDKLVILKNEVNEGLTKSLNKGIRVAKGDYLARMDTDDISLPERFELQYLYMESNPEVVVLGGGMQEIDEDGKWGAERKYPETQDRIIKYISKANPLAHPTTFIRRSIFEEGYRYNENYRKNQDLKLWFDLLKSQKILHNLSDNILLFRRTKDTYAKRSSVVSLNSELSIYMTGIRDLYGPLTWRYIYPLMRYVIKRMPGGINAIVYKYLFKKKNS